MDNLIQDLQKIIQALEALSESPATASEQIDEMLDQLFQQKIDLLNAALNVSTTPYQQAAQAMKQAAAKAERGAREPANIDEALRTISEAITKSSKLLDSVAPIA
ncbi:MAG: spore germination protein GerPC [Methylococcaceae bacterium]|nr:spore germination protein GerPC [Methylococcaceae bacterium]